MAERRVSVVLQGSYVCFQIEEGSEAVWFGRKPLVVCRAAEENEPALWFWYQQLCCLDSNVAVRVCLRLERVLRHRVQS